MLQELSLPASLEALDKPVGLPPSLLKKAEEVRLEDGSARIDASLEDAEHLAERCREILDEVEQSLLVSYSLVLAERSFTAGDGHIRSGSVGR